MLDLPDLLDPERIRCGCELKSKKRTLQTLAELLGASLRGEPAADAAPQPGRDARTEPAVSDMDIMDALIGRERLGSTGLGHGIALPHSRMRDVQAPLAALVTLKQGVDFQATDGEPVDIVLGLLVPEDCNDEHLRILAALAKRFADAELREELRACTDAAELLERLAALPPASASSTSSAAPSAPH